MGSREIKIRILEDNPFYSDLLFKKITTHTGIIAQQNNVIFETRVYQDLSTFYKDLDSDVDLLFTDYYLPKGRNAKEVTVRVARICYNCKVVILSQNKRSYLINELIAKYASHFIYKDAQALNAVCQFIDHYIKTVQKNNVKF